MSFRWLTSLAFVLLAGCVMWTNTAFAQPSGRGSSGSPQAVPEDAGKQIAFELILVERGPEQLAGENKLPNAAQILELEKQGKLGSVQRLKLSALENTEARLMLGESAPMVTGRTRGGGGGGPGAAFAGGFQGSESITYTDLGTTVLVTARVEKGGSVVAALSITRSSMSPSKAPEKVEGQEAAAPLPPRRVTGNISTTARIAPGETAVLCGQQTLTGSTPSELWVLVSAKVQ